MDKLWYWIKSLYLLIEKSNQILCDQWLFEVYNPDTFYFPCCCSVWPLLQLVLICWHFQFVCLWPTSMCRIIILIIKIVCIYEEGNECYNAHIWYKRFFCKTQKLTAHFSRHYKLFSVEQLDFSCSLNYCSPASFIIEP